MNGGNDSSAEAFFQVTERPEWASIIQREVKTGWTPETVFTLWGPLFPIALFISLVLAAGIVYCCIRILQIRRAEWAHFHKHAHSVESEDVPRTHLRWNRIMEHANSDDEHKWRLAILESDIMLSELLDLQGYKGETMADKMKQVSRANFNAIDDAWEAHKVRNRVAHEGVEQQLTEREKNRVIGLYARVFREFGFI
ncbi:hypothetical protein A3A38_02445 [Candidatus Kaiserbacteria bacterium RIFCSPLOWO2_01_FULL_53_17]|uniref:Uncharacterized protein n=1 Tax=Candidatus Kaiserbacteria bacterium RIFCSPLOWO2_01_FULL_53_17 TaxID=1798511 RepID=A0A1F6EHU8_9BACT|nr:MAG: hypothetical protein A3A38_02445 [Candidatus Kaiserbacteria bacterium RIFCSPLOWO2_01_FULL_53_17]